MIRKGSGSRPSGGGGNGAAGATRATTRRRRVRSRFARIGRRAGRVLGTPVRLVRRHPAWATVVLFGLTRIGYVALGLEFNPQALNGQMWHLLDLDALQNDLWRSIWYLHYQPPLFNLLVGVVLNVSPDHAAGILQAIWIGAGLVLALASRDLLARLGVAPVWSVLAAVFLVTDTAYVLYENMLNFTYLEPALLVLFLRSLLAVMQDARGRDRWLAGVSALLLALLRPWLHPLLLLAVAGVMIQHERALDEERLGPGVRLRGVAYLLIPTLLVTAWYGKNQLLFGEFTASTWVGGNLARVTTYSVSEDDRIEMVSDGVLSRLALVGPFAIAAQAQPHVDPPPSSPRTDALALTSAFKANGTQNWNYIGLLPVWEGYQDDAVAFIWARPGDYATAMGRSWQIYFYPPQLGQTMETVLELERIDAAYRRLRGLPRRPPSPFFQPDQWGDFDPTRVELVTVAGFLVVLAWPIGRVIGDRRRGWRFLAYSKTTFLVLTGSIVLIYSVGMNAAELFENNRFRLTIDPFIFLLPTALAFSVARWIRARWRARRAARRAARAARRAGGARRRSLRHPLGGGGRAPVPGSPRVASAPRSTADRGGTDAVTLAQAAAPGGPEPPAPTGTSAS